MTVIDVDLATGQQTIMDDLTAGMMFDINREFRRTSTLTASEQQAWMSDAVPDIWTPYAAASNELAASWYIQTAPDLIFSVINAVIPTPQTIAGQVAWAFTQQVVARAIVGFAQRDLWNQYRQTIVENAEREGVGWARHASANACRFCQMVATRGPVYSSEDAAASVVGTGRNNRTRGTQKYGDKYHKNCHCIAVPVRRGNSYEPAPYVEQWEQDYYTAREMAGEYPSTKSIMAAYREMDKA